MFSSERRLRVEAIGGLGEMGHHHLAIDLGPDSFLIDCGVLFAGPEDPGIDGLYPPLGPALRRSKDGQLRALLLTHAHLDHIGGVPRLLEALPDLPVYGPPFVLRRLVERIERDGPRPPSPLRLEPIEPGVWHRIGATDCRWYSVTHSIPAAHSIALRSDQGTVVHSGDFRVDPQPLLGPKTDEEGLRALGAEGVDLLLLDSTNAASGGRNRSESDLLMDFERLCRASVGRVVVCTFGSHLERVVACARAAQATGRTCGVYGTSLEALVSSELRAGTLGLDREALSPVDAVLAQRREEQFLVVTGSQGEWRAVASRLANRTDPKLRLEPGDCFAFSARAIPGRERAVGYLVNALVDQGVEVFPPWDKRMSLHSSGHAKQEELALYLSWLRPDFVLPLHGEAWHLAEHRRFLRDRGLAGDQILSLRSGQALVLKRRPELPSSKKSGGSSQDSVYIEEGVEVGGRTAKVGSQSFDGDEPALRDRKKALRTGYACAVVQLDSGSVGSVAGVTAVTLGLFPRAERTRVETELAEEVLRALGRRGRGGTAGEQWIEPARLALRRAIQARTGQKCLAEARLASGT